MSASTTGQPPPGRKVSYLRVEAALSVPLLVLSLLMIPLLVVPLFWQHMPRHVAAGFAIADYGIWAVFALEYLLLLALAADRRRFFRTHLFELGLVVLPMLRPLRIARSARGLRAVRAGRVAAGGGTALAISRRQLAVRWAAEPAEAEDEADRREQPVELSDLAEEMRALRARVAGLSGRLAANDQ